jgi:hypothetical protein
MLVVLTECVQLWVVSHRRIMPLGANKTKAVATSMLVVLTECVQLWVVSHRRIMPLGANDVQGQNLDPNDLQDARTVPIARSVWEDGWTYLIED